MAFDGASSGLQIDRVAASTERTTRWLKRCSPPDAARSGRRSWALVGAASTFRVAHAQARHHGPRWHRHRRPEVGELDDARGSEATIPRSGT